MGYFKTLSDALLNRRTTRAASSNHDGASGGRRLATFTGTTTGPNTLAISDGPMLVARATKLVMENPYAANAVDAYVSNAIGKTGIVPQWQHPKKAVRKKLTEAWRKSSPEVDADGRTDWAGIQSLIARMMMIQGESIVRFRPRLLSDNLTVPLQAQVIEGAQLPFFWQSGGNGNNLVRAGVEFDAIGRRVAYHLYKHHPGDALIYTDALDVARVPADQILHMFRPTRAGLIRGITWFSSMIVDLYQLDSYDDAELERKRLSTMFMGVVREINPDQPLNNQVDTAGTATAAPGTTYGSIQPGTLLKADAGEQIDWNEPPDVGTMYEAFFRVQLRKLALGFGLADFQFSGDPQGLNFSTARTFLLEFRRRCEQFQFQVMAFQFCQPFINRWLDAAALAGVIDASDYAKNKADYRAIEWRTAAWKWVDPLKDIQAERESIRSGFKSRSQSVYEQGLDPETVEAEIAAENERADAQGFIFDCDPRVTDLRGQATNAQETGDDGGSDSNAKPKDATSGN